MSQCQTWVDEFCMLMLLSTVMREKNVLLDFRNYMCYVNEFEAYDQFVMIRNREDVDLGLIHLSKNYDVFKSCNFLLKYLQIRIMM